MSGPWEEFQQEKAPVSGPWDDFKEVPHTPQVKAVPAKKAEAPSGFAKGMRDPVDAGAQLLTNMLPKGITDPVNRLNNWLADKTGLVGKLPEGGVDQQVREQEAQYQQQRSAAGETGFDWGRLGGNVLNPANLAVAARIPQAATLAGRVGLGAASGGLFGAAQPVTQGDFATEKAKQVGLGAVTGGAVPVATGALARVIKPKSSPEVQTLLKAGVVPTPGQQIGGLAKNVEEKLTSLPFVGDMVKNAQVRGLQEFNRAGINRALNPIGQKLPKSVPVGREGLDYAINQIDDAYNNLLPKLGGTLDDQMTAEINSLKQSIADSNIPEPVRSQFDRIIKNEVVGRFTEGGKASGETVKAIESKLGELANTYKRGDYDQQTVGGAVKETQAALRRMLERNNPEYKGELSKVNTAYANLMKIQTAAASIGAKEGVFTPGQLNRAVKSQDISKNKRAFARGKATMQDLADAGNAVLSPNIPNSGTIDRGMLLWMLSHPVHATAAGASAVAGAIPYSRLGSQALGARPEFATPLAEAIRNASPYLTPGVVPMTYGLSKDGK